jgi:hypothetical protein
MVEKPACRRQGSRGGPICPPCIEIIAGVAEKVNESNGSKAEKAPACRRGRKRQKRVLGFKKMGNKIAPAAHLMHF